MGPLPLSSSSVRVMSDGTRQKRRQAPIYVLVAAVSLATLSLLFFREWYVAPSFPSKFWNAVAAFVILGIVSDSFSFTIPFAKVSTSVSFVPFLAAVSLFPHPWPMVIGGITGFVADRFVRRKPLLRVWFNTAQYMLATGLGALVYSEMGGTVSLDSFDFALVPFASLVLEYFVVNKGSVALAVLLVFLYVKLQLLGLAILIFPLLLVRQLYQMNLQLQEELEEKLELMVKAMEARDPYTSGHSRRVSEYALAIARELRLP